MRMKGLACPCPALPKFLELGTCLMAEGSRTQASSQGPPINIQFLRAQYEGLRRQQKTQAHLMVLPKEGTMPTPAESMTSAVWINKERRSSLSPEEPAACSDSEAEGMLEEVDRSCHPAPETPWHTYLELHRLVQTFHLEADHQGDPKGCLVEPEPRLSPKGDTNVLKKNQKTQQEIKIPEVAQWQSQEGCAPLQAAGSGAQCLSSTKNPHRSGKPAYYPFPQRKPPRISQAARNLGLYGPP